MKKYSTFGFEKSTFFFVNAGLLSQGVNLELALESRYYLVNRIILSGKRVIKLLKTELVFRAPLLTEVAFLLDFPSHGKNVNLMTWNPSGKFCKKSQNVQNWNFFENLKSSSLEPGIVKDFFGSWDPTRKKIPIPKIAKTFYRLHKI